MNPSVVFVSLDRPAVSEVSVNVMVVAVESAVKFQL